MIAKKIFFILLIAVCVLQAESLYVNPQTGSDSNNGLSPQTPVLTIAKGISLATAGDTVYLGGAVFKGRREQVFVSKSGEPDKPIVIDGQGAVIDGCEPIDPNDWVMVEPGLYKNEAIFKKNLQSSEDWVTRFSFVMDGKLNRMGHSLKSPSDPYLKPAQLQEGQWTYDISDHSYYVKIDPSKTLADYRIESPVVVSGVQVSGDVHHIVFKNITVKHVINDGFALTIGGSLDNKVSDISFENITAIECCDDGFSGHGDCDVRVDGFVIDGCGTGICGQGSSVNNRVVTRNIHAADIYMGSGRHVFTNSYFDSTGRLGSVIAMVWANQYGYDSCSVELKNVVVKGNQIGANSVKAEGKGVTVVCEKSTLYGVSIIAKSEAAIKLYDSVVAGSSFTIDLQPQTIWQADRNHYDIANINFNKIPYRAKEFDAYRQVSRQDANSKWRQIEVDRIANVNSPIIPVDN